MSSRIPLYARDGSIRAHAIVDDDDFAWLDQWRWCLRAKKYAGRYAGGGRKKQRIEYMHRLILGLAHGDPREADHRNKDTLDNRRVNLRIATHPQNGQNVNLSGANTSGYRGVSWDKHRQKWAAYVAVDRKQRHVGRFDTAEEAAQAAAKARRELLPFDEHG